MIHSRNILYPLLTILTISGRKSFKELGRTIDKSGEWVKRSLNDCDDNFHIMQKLAQQHFKDEKRLFVIIDDTLIKKIYSSCMQGSGQFFDTKIGRRITAFRLVAGMIAGRKVALPFECSYLFSKDVADLITQQTVTKDAIAKAIVMRAIELFPNKKIIVTADGLYANTTFIAWCKEQGICLQVRIRSNAVVEYRGKRMVLKEFQDVKKLRLTGRKMTRTFSAKWHGMDLEFTIDRRFDRHGIESFVFQAATYQAPPRDHIAHYKKRWLVEEMFRTTKQSLGLQDCFSTSLKTQKNHVTSVFLAYAICQIEKNKRRLKNVEEAIRSFKAKNKGGITMQFSLYNKLFSSVFA